MSCLLKGQEDCLYINVYTPDVVDSNLPVMVWLHGGGFIAGSGTWGDYGPHKFLDTQKVILVLFSYFLSLRVNLTRFSLQLWTTFTSLHRVCSLAI